MDKCFSQLREAELEALSSVIAELNMLRANGSEESSIATEDALRYLRAAKYNSAKAIEIYKNYQKNREVYGLDDVKPYREPLNSEISSGKIQILGTSDHEDSPILLFTASKHDSKYSKLDAAMQLLFHTLDQIATNDSAQNKGIVFLFDLRDSSQDPKFLRSFISVLLNGYPLMLKVLFIVGAPMWVKPILMTFRQLNKIKFVSTTDLMHHFADHQLPISLGGKFHPHPDATPTSPTHDPPRPKLPRQRSHPDNLCEIVQDDRVGERLRHVRNVVPVLDSRGRSHSGSAADRSNLRPLQPPHRHGRQFPPSSGPHPPPITTPSKPHPDTSPPPPDGGSCRQKLKNRFLRQDKQDDHSSQPPRTKSHHPPPFVVNGNTRKATPTSPSHSSETGGASGRTEEPQTRSHTTPTSPVKVSGTGVASRIQNFERQTESGSSTNSPLGAKGHGKPTDTDRDVAQRSRHGGRQTRPLVSVQIASGGGDGQVRGEERGHNLERGGGEQEKEGKKEHSREEELRRRREEEMRRLWSQPHRMERQGEKEKEQKKPPPSSLSDDYENVDLRPPSTSKMKHIFTSKESSARIPDKKRKGQEMARDNSTDYENVAIHYTKSGTHSPEPLKLALGPTSTSGGGAKSKPLRETKEKGGAVSATSPQKKPQYENITILTASGPMPYLNDLSSSEESEDFSGDESPAPKEVIYENFGFDSGNQPMSAEEIERHLATKEKNGISAEYLRIKNEPLAFPYIACKLQCNISKNRYKDVVCYDNSRVILERIPGIEGSDYIHANYVSSYKKSKAFILTQGPTKKTLVDFWRMVWEQQVRVIVMTTKCVELGRHKCTQYWPDEGIVKYGNVTVTVAKLQQCDGYELRTMTITSAGEERTIKHFQFLAWPDYGVPTSGQSVLDLIFAVREATSREATSTDQKVIVHCSAGVGRSGAFCVINNCIDESKERGSVNIQGAVRALRLQRAYAIQTDEQYDFCYKTVLQHMKSRHR